MRAGVFAVVSGKDDNRIVAGGAVGQGPENDPNLAVDVLCQQVI